MTEQRRFKISGTGCTLIDYLYSPVSFEDTEFAKYLSKTPGDGGLSPGKLVFKEEFDKYSGENYLQVRDVITKSNEPVAVNIGGPSIVSLIHASQLLSDFPVEVNFYACRGNDKGGGFIEEMLRKTQVKTGNFKIGTNYTPFTDVLSDPSFDHGHGERIFINNIGAAWEMTPDDLDDSFFASDLVVFGGTALVPNIHSELGDLLLKAKSRGAVTVVNTVYDFLSEKKDPTKPWMLGKSPETYKSIDLLITDMEEALRLSGKSDAIGAIEFFKSTGVGATIVTHGSNDLLFFADSPLFGEIPLASLPVSAKVVHELVSDPEKKGDTTGCGDNFAGGVIASIARQLLENQERRVELRQAIALGVASGGFACFYNGGTYYEEHPGQKAGLVETYYQAYQEQIRKELATP